MNATINLFVIINNGQQTYSDDVLTNVKNLNKETIMYYHPFTTGNSYLSKGSNSSLDRFFGGTISTPEVKDEIITENFFS